jgi:hypothetical protein
MLLIIARVMYQGNNTPQQAVTQMPASLASIVDWRNCRVCDWRIRGWWGFLIVPAMVLLVGLPMSEAVGTSLIVSRHQQRRKYVRASRDAT